MKDLLNAIADGVLIIDKDYEIVFANKALLDLCSLSAEDIVGRKCHASSHRCPTPCALPERCPHKEVFSTGKSVAVKHTHSCQDGRKRIFSITASPIIDDNGNVIRMVEILKDITEEEKTAESLRAAFRELENTSDALRKSEAFVRNILDSVEEGFIIIDPEFRIVAANRAFCEQVKCRVENVAGKYCYEVSHHLDKPCFWAGEECAPSRTFKTGASSLAIHTHHDSEGKPLYIETRSYPIKDASGTVTAVIETLNNITEVRRLEGQLRHAQKMEAIGTLAGGIAHDFNNLLSVIIGYGELTQMRAQEDDHCVPQLKEILAAAHKAAQLTSGLLAFSRKQVMDLKAVSINEFISVFKKMLDRIIGEDIELKVLPTAENVVINADRSQIEQVLMNLAVNARDAMPHGGILIIQAAVEEMDSHFINTHGFGEPGRYAVITVTDTGTGITEDTRRRIFEPYFTTKELGRGTGLGLSIAFGIVKQHKGFLECLSNPGKGASFKIYIPVFESGETIAEGTGAVAAEGGTETILVAEDDSAVRDYMKQVLNSFGYSVIEAFDGEDAVNKFKENKDRIQLLLLDVIMPKKTGKDAYEDIRGLKPGIKAICISGYAQDLIQDRGILDDGLEFLQKPVTPALLLKKIREVLDR